VTGHKSTFEKRAPKQSLDKAATRDQRVGYETPVSKCGALLVAARGKFKGLTPMCSRKKWEKFPGVENP